MLYEALLLIAVWAIATFIFIKILGDATSGPKHYALQIYLWLIAAGYFIWSWLKGGQTLAMQTWKIRLVSHEGDCLSLNAAIKRFILATLSLMFFGAGFIWAIFDRDGQFLHDRLTGSKLILVKSPSQA